VLPDFAHHQYISPHEFLRHVEPNPQREQQIQLKRVMEVLTVNGILLDFDSETRLYTYSWERLNRATPPTKKFMVRYGSRIRKKSGPLGSLWDMFWKWLTG